MPKSCGNIVNILGSTLGKTRAWLSPKMHHRHSMDQLIRVQPSFIHITFPLLSQLISPLRIAVSPLIEHYLYPVSTAPTNSHNQGKLKKGNK